MDACWRRQGSVSPPILTLLELIEEHRSAFAYDWRTRFGMPASEIGRGMTWAEAWDLTTILSTDPSSQVAAAVSGWSHPLGWEALTLAHLYDRFVEANTSKGKPKPYPRPWDKTPKSLGNASMTTTQMRALLDEHRTSEHVSAGVVVDPVRPEPNGLLPG